MFPCIMCIFLLWKISTPIALLTEIFLCNVLKLFQWFVLSVTLLHAPVCVLPAEYVKNGAILILSHRWWHCS